MKGVKKLEKTNDRAYYYAMDHESQLGRAFKAWVTKIGKHEAIKRLVLGGVSPVTADKLCNFRYQSTPGGLLTKVLIDEMEKDGLLIEAS